MARDTTIKVIIEGQDKTGPAIQGATSGLKSMGAGMLKSAAAFGVAQAAASALIGTVVNLAESLSKLGPTAIKTAGSFQEMGLVAQAVGQTVGMQRDEINQAIDDLNKAGIRYDAASRSVALFARNQVDLAYSTQLANVAQGAAVLLQEDSSETMNKLMMAISTGNSYMLRRMLLSTQLKEEEKKFAEALGKTVDQLTQREKVEARVQAIIRDSATLTNVYGAAMESPTKALRSLTGRVLPEMYASLGQMFLPAWKSVIDTVSTAAKAIKTAANEGGSLYPILVNLGAVASMAADGFKNLVKGLLPAQETAAEAANRIWRLEHHMSALPAAAEKAGKGLLTGLVDRLMTAASAAFSGGIEIVASLAEGIVQGIASTLTSVMNYLSSVLTSWLAPHSAPKIVAGLMDWSRETFQMYLEGFSAADFGVLEKLQSPLQEALSTMVSSGDMGKDVAQSLYADLSQEMAGVLAKFQETGELDTSIFDKLTEAGGKFGAELAELARRQLEFAGATKAVEEAETALKNALTEQEDAQGSLSTIMDEYNQLLREGADPKALAAKKKEFEAAKARVDAAEDGVKAAEKQKKRAEEQLDPLQEQVTIQERLLKQLMQFEKLQSEMQPITKALGIDDLDKALKKVAGGGGAGAAIEDILPTFDVDPTQLGDPIKDAIDAAKLDLQTRMEGLFQPLTDAWTTTQETFSGLVPQFQETMGHIQQVIQEYWPIIRDTVVGSVQTIYDWVMINWPVFRDTVLGIVEEIRLWFETNWPIIQAVAVTAWTVIQDIALTVVDVFRNTILPQFQEAFASVTEAIQGWGWTWEDVWNAVKTVLQVAGITIGALLVALLSVITGVVTAIAHVINALADAWASVSNGIRNIITGLTEWFAHAFGLIKAIISGDTDAMMFHLRGAWEGMKLYFQGVLETISGIFTATFGFILAAIGGFVEGVIEFFQSLYDRLVGHSIITDMVNEIQTVFSGGLIEAVQTVLEKIGSIVDLIGGLIGGFKRAGENLMASLIDGMVTVLQDHLLPALEIVSVYMSDTVVYILEERLIPLVMTLDEWLLTVVSTITNSLMPILQRLYFYIMFSLKPAIEALDTSLSALATTIRDTLNPPLETMRGKLELIKGWMVKIRDVIMDEGGLKQGVGDLAYQITTYLNPALETLEGKLLRIFKGFRNANEAASGLLGTIKNINNALNNLHIPDDLSPGSPSPFESALRGINDAMLTIAGVGAPAMQGAMGSTTQTTIENNYNLGGVTLTGTDFGAVEEGFAILRALWG